MSEICEGCASCTLSTHSTCLSKKSIISCKPITRRRLERNNKRTKRDNSVAVELPDKTVEIINLASG